MTELPSALPAEVMSAEVVQLGVRGDRGGERRVIAVIDDQILVRQGFAQSLEAA